MTSNVGYNLQHFLLNGDKIDTEIDKGYRVIGLAHKKLPTDINWLKVQKMKRDQAEKDLNFLGFLIMQNTLKPQTTPVIRELLAADIRTVMVTGDNLLTAVSVARYDFFSMVFCYQNCSDLL